MIDGCTSRSPVSKRREVFSFSRSAAMKFHENDSEQRNIALTTENV